MVKTHDISIDVNQGVRIKTAARLFRTQEKKADFPYLKRREKMKEWKTLKFHRLYTKSTVLWCWSLQRSCPHKHKHTDTLMQPSAWRQSREQGQTIPGGCLASWGLAQRWEEKQTVCLLSTVCTVYALTVLQRIFTHSHYQSIVLT